MISIYVTCKDKKETLKISKILLKKKLIACSNMFPIESMYNWKGKLYNEKEYVMILKTKKKLFNQVSDVIKKNHSYKVPCICTWNIGKLSKEYKNYIDEEIK